MPWRETSPMQERIRFVRDFRSGLYAMTELCERYGISRKTGYKWLRRFDAEGAAGLEEKSRAPHTCPPSHARRGAVGAARRAEALPDVGSPQAAGLARQTRSDSIVAGRPGAQPRTLSSRRTR
jgi:transposase-like protein